MQLLSSIQNIGHRFSRKAAWSAVVLLPALVIPAAAQTLDMRPPGMMQVAVAAWSDAVADYRRRLAEYLAIRESFEADAKAYWSAITDKRRGRNTKRREGQPITLDDYVLDQPPVYTGPKRPVDPSPPESSGPRRPPKTMPVVADFLKAAADHFNFVPERGDEARYHVH